MRLKKARGYWRDARSGLDAEDEACPAGLEWRTRTWFEIKVLQQEVQRLIDEVDSGL